MLVALGHVRLACHSVASDSPGSAVSKEEFGNHSWTLTLFQHLPSKKM